MKFDEAIQLMDRSVISSKNISEARVKQQFSNILNELKYKQFSQLQSVTLEKELDALFTDLNLETENNTELQKRLNDFIKMLRLKYEIIPEGYWTLNGVLFGIIAGLLFLGFLISFTDSPLKFYSPLAGLILGVGIGSLKDLQIKKRGRTLITKMY